MMIQHAVHGTRTRAEQRNDVRRQARLDEARELLEPLLGRDSHPISGSACYRALNRLHESFPELSAMELEALVASVARDLGKRTDH